MRETGKLLLVAGFGIALVGVVLIVAGRSGLGRLPGDVSFTLGNARVYVPLATSLLLSIALTVLFNLFLRR